jgi:hypothetical protein
MEEEIIAGTAIDAGVIAGLAPDSEADAKRANDHKSEFRSETDLDQCSNCHTALSGRYCHVCGQVADTFHRPFWSLFADIFDGMFGLDGRIWKTVPPLLLRPGHVTVRYLSGYRKPYIQPFKLFLASSVLFFLVFALATKDKSGMVRVGPDGANFTIGDTDTTEAEKAEALQELGDLKDQLATDIPEGPGRDLAQQILSEVTKNVENRETVDQAELSKPGSGDDPVSQFVNGFVDGVTDDAARPKDQPEDQPEDQPKPKVDKNTFVCGIQTWLIPEDVSDECRAKINAAEKEHSDEEIKVNLANGKQMSIDNNENWVPPLSLENRRFLAGNLETVVRDPDRYSETLMQWAPRMGFLLAPVYGMMLALTFFWRRKLYFYDHMIVALHFHSFLFLFLAILIPVGMMISVPVAGMTFLVWSNFYLYRLHRRVYGCNRFTAFLRTLFLDISYVFILTFALMVLMLLGVLFV